MKKVKLNGAAVKLLRKNLESGSTQKELCAVARISERLLREVENNDTEQPIATIDRLAKALGVRRERIVYSLDGPRLVSGTGTDLSVSSLDDDKDRLIPRFDYDYADATMDEGRLFNSAASASDIVCHYETPLSGETGTYAQELLDVLTSLTWSCRDILKDIPASEEMALRRRLRQLLVLLKGNDVWVYETHYERRLPERYDLPLPGEQPQTVLRVSLVFGPPGEYGETSMRIQVDNGQPYVLLSWKSFREKWGEMK